MFPISITLWLIKKKRKTRLNRDLLKIYFTRRKKVIDEIEEMEALEEIDDMDKEWGVKFFDIHLTI